MGLKPLMTMLSKPLVKTNGKKAQTWIPGISFLISSF